MTVRNNWQLEQSLGSGSMTSAVDQLTQAFSWCASTNLKDETDKQTHKALMANSFRLLKKSD